MRYVFVVFAVIVSLGWIIFIPNEPVSDQAIYHRTAVDLIAGKGYIDDSGDSWGYWAPGYSYYLAAFYKIFGDQVATAFAANWLAYAMLVSGVFFLGKELYGSKVGWISAILTALYPSFIFYNTILASETLFSAISIWAIVFLWKAFEGRWGWLIVSGLLMGFATLVRGQGLIFPIMALVIGYVRGASRFKTFGSAMLAGIVAVIVLIPWGLRNQKELGTFVLVSANSGANLWIGNHPGATGGYVDPQPYIDDEGIAEWPLPERDAYLKQKAIEFIKGHPVEFAALVVKRAWITMKRESIPAVWNKIGIEKRFGENGVFYLKLLTNAVYVLLLLLCLTALIYSIRKRAFVKEDWILFSMIALLSLQFLLFIGQDRYHLGLVPYWILFSVSRCTGPRSIGAGRAQCC